MKKVTIWKCDRNLKSTWGGTKESRRPFPGIRDNELNSSTIPPKTGRVVTLISTLIMIKFILPGLCGGIRNMSNPFCYKTSESLDPSPPEASVFQR